MKKPTLATLKSFINKNRPALHINCVSSFDGMQDCVAYKENSRFKPATKSDGYKNTLGINGVWVVGRDSISPYEKDGFKGFEVYNCCGTFIVAVPA